jgi:integrase/recombinase XerC
MQEPAVERFLQWLDGERRLAINTQLAYRRDLELLWGVYESTPTITTLTQQRIRHALSKLHAQDRSAKSLARILSSWRQFYQYLVDREDLPLNPCIGVSAPKIAKTLPNVLTAEQAIGMIQSIDQGDWTQRRDRAVLELTYSCGLRVSEVVGLNIDQVDLADATARVLGKGSKTRVVPIGEHAVNALQAWLTLRNTQSAKDSQALFLNTRGERLGVRAVQTMVKRYGRAAGLSVDVHPHMLRHSCASHVLQSSQDLRAVQELLGHASIASTQVYTHLDFAHLAKVYDTAHPRAKRK